ncbi:MAG: calcium/sodium antiporter [Kofleriaceae bacterium]
MALDLVWLAVGLGFLYVGAEWLVAGAAGLARSFGVSSLVVGLTVVAYGTSAPELVVGLRSASSGQGAIALGNVIGSNIANLGLILGMTMLVLPGSIDRALARRELPILVLSAAALPVILRDGVVTPWEAALLLAAAVGYSLWMLMASIGNGGAVGAVAEVEAEAEAAVGLAHRNARWRLAARAVAGLGCLVIGGDRLVLGASGIAKAAGLSDHLIGVTIVAVGTSLPELATSIVAAVRGHSDLAIGNVVGSNIFNVLLIGGAAGLAGPIGAPLASVTVDLIALGGLTLFAVAVMATRPRFGRLAASVLVLGYVAFLIALIAG